MFPLKRIEIEVRVPAKLCYEYDIGIVIESKQ